MPISLLFETYYSQAMAWTAVVLAGGRSKRLGRDKAMVTVAGRSLLDWVLSAVPPSSPVIVAGPQRPTSRPDVRWVLEDPPDGGPVAGIVASLAHVDSSVTVIVATDMPFVAAALRDLASELAAAPPAVDAVVLADEHGRRQLLCGAYRTERLRERAQRWGSGHNLAIRDFLGELRIAATSMPVATELALDVDTPDDVQRARSRPRARLDEEVGIMDEWVREVCRVLGVTDDIDVAAILDVAKDVAHNVQRPAAPVTAYLLGVAVGRGMSPEEAAATASELAAQWPLTPGPVTPA